MITTTKKVFELVEEGIIDAPMDGNHGEKHPKTSDYVPEGIPFILVPDLLNGKVDLEHCNYITLEQAMTLSKGFSKTGDVLLTHKGTIGKVALVDTKENEFIILTPQVTYYRVKNSEVISNKYLYYYFNSAVFQQTFRQFASSGGTRDYLGIVAQLKLPISYPSYHMQNRIASILSAYDELIENNNHKIAILQEQALELYKEWFVRFRFPGHEAAKFENDLPEGWVECRFSEMADIMSGGTPKTDEASYYGGSIPFYTPKDRADNYFSFETLTNITEEGLAHCNSQFYPAKTVMITARGTVGNINLLAVPMAMNQSCYALKMKAVNCPYFLFFSLMQEIKKLKCIATGGVFDTIIVKTFDTIRLVMPKTNMLMQFERAISPIMEQILYIEKKNKNLICQRDLLLPRLMSGKLEVQ